MSKSRLFATMLATVFCCTLLANTDGTTESTTPGLTSKTLQQADVLKSSEAFGHLIGRNLDNTGLTFDLDSIIKGMRDAAAGLQSPMTDQEYEEAISQLQESAFNELAEVNLEEADEFLKENAKGESVVEIEEGRLQYQVVTEGEGESVSEGSAPSIHYTGTYIDGTVFGTSEESDGPITLPLDQTIPGFQKAVVGMKEGEKRRIYIHPDLGYGTAGHMPPNSLLVFDVEVVSTNNTAATTVQTAATEETPSEYKEIAEINTDTTAEEAIQ